MTLIDGTPEGGEANVNVAALGKRLDNLEATVKGSLKELNTQLDTVWHAHTGLARQFEELKQARSNHASRLLHLDHAITELDGAMATVNTNVDACLRHAASFEE